MGLFWSFVIVMAVGPYSLATVVRITLACLFFWVAMAFLLPTAKIEKLFAALANFFRY